MGQLLETFDEILNLLANNQLSEGKTALAKLQNDGNSHPIIVLLQGLIAFYENDFANARDMLLQSCLESPRFEAFLFLAKAEQQLNKPASSKSVLDQGFSLFPIEVLDPHLTKQAATVYFQLGAFKEVIDTLQKYLSDNPNDISALKLLGASYSNIQSPKEALDAYHKVFELNRTDPSVHVNLSVVMRQLRELKSAKKHLEMAGRLDRELYDPSSLSLLSASLLEFGDFDHYSKDAIALLSDEGKVTEPFSFFFITDDPNLLKLANEKYSSKFEPSAFPTKKISNRSSKRIRIGYVSADFKNHATTYLISELIKKHDREDFEVFGFDFSNQKQSNYRDEVLGSFDKVVDLHHQTDEAAAEKIKSEKIDVLIDLKGYTENCRPNLFSKRPSPIQVNYLGYPGTMGNPSIDYIIGDRVVTPISHQENFSESIVSLPCCYQPNNPARSVGKPKTKKELGLPDDKFIFCCFNHHWKLNKDVVSAWAEILSTCTNSILWIMEPLTGADLKQKLKDANIPSDRIITAKAVKIEDHLARLMHADLFLDTFPCGAHTTASDAIFAGVPVLTILGKSFHSRVSSSIMLHAGLPEFICEDIENYINKAIGAYRDADWTRAQTSVLLNRTLASHPYNIETTVKSLEVAYQKMANATQPNSIIIDPWW